MEIHLTHMEKLMAITIAAGVVLLAFILVVCSVGPGCWINNMLERRRRRRQAEKGLYSGVFTTLKKRENNGYGSYPDFRMGTMRASMSSYSSVTQSMKSNTSSDGRDSTYSSLSESGRSSPTMMSQAGIPHSVIVEEEEGQSSSHDSSLDADKMLGQVAFSLKYIPDEKDPAKGRLVVGLQEAVNLPPREYLGSGDPYFLIKVLKEKRSLRRSRDTQLAECQSKILRKTRNPVFAQTFTLDVAKDQLKDCRVELQAWDHDRLASPTLLGETSQALRDVRQLTSSPEQVSLSYYLSPGKQNFGEVMFGLSYLPTAQRLSFSIIKANNVKHARVCADVEHFSPYIRVIMVNNLGKSLKKKKTTTKKGTASPVFNENLIFNINNYQLDTLTFLVVMCHKIYGESPSDEDSVDSSMSKEAPKNKDLYVGKIALGMHVRGETEKAHWMEMIKQPRRSISQAHVLK